MTESTHTLTALVVHRLIRAAEGPSQLELRAAPNPLDDASARLMERLCRYFAERPGKGFGHFERDERSFPMPAMVRRHVIEESIDFTAFSAEMLAHLQQRVDEDKVDDGGYVLIGMRQASFLAFADIAWSTERVLQQTRQRLASLGWQWAEFEPFWDVDRREDFERLLQFYPELASLGHANN